MIELYRSAPFAVTAVAGVATLSGGVLTLADSASGTVHAAQQTMYVTAVNDPSLAISLTVSCPAGKVGTTWDVNVFLRNVDSSLQETVTQRVVVTPGQTVTATLAFATPAWCDHAEWRLTLVDGVAGPNRAVVLTNLAISRTAAVDEILSLTLARPLNRLANDSGAARTPIVASGQPGSRQGVMTCLLSSLPATTALDALCCGGKITVPPGVFGDDPLTLWPTKLVFASERALPGTSSRFVASIDVKEA